MDVFPNLTTQRLVLREFRPSDAPAVFDIFSRDTVTKYHNQDTMRSLREAEDLVARRASLWSTGIGLRWAIALADRVDRVIGSCGCYSWNRAFRYAEIGYDLHPTYWRRGIMTEALTAAIEYCFSGTFSFQLNRIEALTHIEHVASIALLWKLGFQEEGIRREYGYWKNQFHDLRCFSLLRRDWESSQRAKMIEGTQGTNPGIAGGQQPLAGSPSAPGLQRSRRRGWIV